MALRFLMQSNPACKLSVPKAVVGELYGAGSPMQVLTAALAIQRSTCLPLIKASDGIRHDPYAPPHVSSPTGQAIGSVLINSRGVGGVNASLLLKR
jgi:3-oxoacyl-(acyl-carrier-protein) synthase